MNLITDIAQGISLVFFTGYGLSCFLSKNMVAEFDRYRVGPIRKLTGGLQLLACAGLLAGYSSRPLLLVSSGGLTFMMLVAVVVRVRIGDSVYKSIPAFSFLCLNLLIFLYAWVQRGLPQG